jgi:hypothetical protein
METEHYLFLLSMSVLAVLTCVYGTKFLAKGNLLLGVQWLVVACAGASIVVFALGDVDAAYRIAYFCDAFTRGCGGPVVMTLGLMVATHRYEPLPCFDVYLLAGSAAGTAALMAADAAAPVRSLFYLVMWGLFSLYLAWFAWKLLAVQAFAHAFGVAVVLVSTLAIAVGYDYVALPGDEEHLQFYILAGPVWSFMAVELYYAYCALERAVPAARPDQVFPGCVERLF